MAYVRCGKCEWEQDDCWSFKINFRFLDYQKRLKPKIWGGYNPLYCFVGDFFRHLKPKWNSYDKYFVDELKEFYPNLNLKTRVVKKPWVPKKVDKYNRPTLKDSHEVFSWSMIKLSLARNIKRFRNMKWWTEKAFKNDQDKTCPKCGEKNNFIWD